MVSIETIHEKLLAIEGKLDAAHEKLDTLKYASCIIVFAIIAAFVAGVWLG